MGDVRNIKAENLPKIDILLGGSPCQGFSFAGKQLNFEDPRSKLFFEYVRLLEECKPRWFLLENVRMKKENLDVISKKLDINPIKINSSLLSAQNRIRYYWTNIPNISEPKDKKIFLKDIIKEDYDGIWVFPRGNNKGGVKSYNRKSPCLTSSSWQHNFLIFKGAARRTYPRYPTGEKRVKRLEIRKDEKSNCLTSAINDALVFEEKSGCVRQFTRSEAEKLQTLPVGYTNEICKSQAFKVLGNGWTVDVIAHILKNIK